MTRRLLLGYVSLTLFVLVVLEIPLGITFARFERTSLRAGVRRDAAALALAAEEPLQTGQGRPLVALVAQYHQRTAGRAVIVDVQGNVRADSDPLRDGPRNFSSRPEIDAALANREVVGHRHSDSLRTNLLYVAVPVASGGVVRGAVRVTYPESFVEARVRRGWLVLAGVGLSVLGFVYLLSIQLARSVTRPLRELELAAGRMGEGELDARVAVLQGPPELRVLAHSFNETADKLERMVDQQRRFAADASHQLRTPLAALRLRLENVEAEVDAAVSRGRGAATATALASGAATAAAAASTELSDDIQGAIAEVHRLSRLVDGLLALARAERSDAGVGAGRVPVDVAAIVAEAGVRWQPLVEEHGVTLSTWADPPLWALATPGHLEQVIDNLVANAVDVAPAGSTVDLRAAVAGSDGGGDNGSVEVHVVDSGPGMTAEQRDHAFDRFWRSSEARSKLGGSGLGLSIVRQLVMNDGGSVVLLEAAGGGLDACVRLQRCPPPEAGPGELSVPFLEGSAGGEGGTSSPAVVTRRCAARPRRRPTPPG